AGANAAGNRGWAQHRHQQSACRASDSRRLTPIGSRAGGRQRRSILAARSRRFRDVRPPGEGAKHQRSPLNEAYARGRGAARWRIRRGRAMGDRASDHGWAISRRPRLYRCESGPHHGRHRILGSLRGRMARAHGRPATGRAASPHSLEALGVSMTNTCINYQTIMPPVLGEHVAYGDTGVVIDGSSVCGARSNFEGGPSALAAALTGRTPRYGYHLDERRCATLVINVDFTPRELNDWGALGAIVGRLAGDYWHVPALVGIERVPSSDEMKHFGAALASYGSVALFHMAGITPEAQRIDDVLVSGRT